MAVDFRKVCLTQTIAEVLDISGFRPEMSAGVYALVRFTWPNDRLLGNYFSLRPYFAGAELAPKSNCPLAPTRVFLVPAEQRDSSRPEAVGGRNTAVEAGRRGARR